MTTYRWKPQAQIAIDAQAAGEELERIKRNHNGRLDREAIVEAARAENNPLHDHFEWDVEKAAQAHWMMQAGDLVRAIVMIQDEAAPDAAPIRAFVSVTSDEDRFYVSTVDALSDPELRGQVLDQAWRELEAWRQRHAELTEFAKVFATIDKARSAKS